MICLLTTPVVCLQVCSKTITQIPDYIQIVGIILGMCTLGYLGDKIGRKWGSVFTASVMLVGAILLTATDGPSEKSFVIMYIIAQVCCASCILCNHASCVAIALVPPSGLHAANIVLLLYVGAAYAVASAYFVSYSLCCLCIARGFSAFLCNFLCRSWSCSGMPNALYALYKASAVCSSPLVTVWEESTPWLLALLLSVLRPRAVPLPGRGDVR